MSTAAESQNASQRRPQSLAVPNKGSGDNSPLILLMDAATDSPASRRISVRSAMSTQSVLWNQQRPTRSANGSVLSDRSAMSGPAQHFVVKVGGSRTDGQRAKRYGQSKHRDASPLMQQEQQQPQDPRQSQKPNAATGKRLQQHPSPSQSRRQSSLQQQPQKYPSVRSNSSGTSTSSSSPVQRKDANRVFPQSSTLATLQQQSQDAQKSKSSMTGKPPQQITPLIQLPQKQQSHQNQQQQQQERADHRRSMPLLGPQPLPRTAVPTPQATQSLIQPLISGIIATANAPRPSTAQSQTQNTASGTAGMKATAQPATRADTDSGEDALLVQLVTNSKTTAATVPPGPGAQPRPQSTGNKSTKSRKTILQDDDLPLAAAVRVQKAVDPDEDVPLAAVMKEVRDDDDDRPLGSVIAAPTSEMDEDVPLAVSLGTKVQDDDDRPLSIYSQATHNADEDVQLAASVDEDSRPLAAVANDDVPIEASVAGKAYDDDDMPLAAVSHSKRSDDDDVPLAASVIPRVQDAYDDDRPLVAITHGKGSGDADVPLAASVGSRLEDDDDRPLVPASQRRGDGDDDMPLAASVGWKARDDDDRPLLAVSKGKSYSGGDDDVPLGAPIPNVRDNDRPPAVVTSNQGRGDTFNTSASTFDRNIHDAEKQRQPVITPDVPDDPDDNKSLSEARLPIDSDNPLAAAILQAMGLAYKEARDDGVDDDLALSVVASDGASIASSFALGRSPTLSMRDSPISRKGTTSPARSLRDSPSKAIASPTRSIRDSPRKATASPTRSIRDSPRKTTTISSTSSLRNSQKKADVDEQKDHNKAQEPSSYSHSNAASHVSTTESDPRLSEEGGVATVSAGSETSDPKLSEQGGVAIVPAGSETSESQMSEQGGVAIVPAGSETSELKMSVQGGSIPIAPETSSSKPDIDNDDTSSSTSTQIKKHSPENDVPSISQPTAAPSQEGAVPDGPAASSSSKDTDGDNDEDTSLSTLARPQEDAPGNSLPTSLSEPAQAPSIETGTGDAMPPSPEKVAGDGVPPPQLHQTDDIVQDQDDTNEREECTLIEVFIPKGASPDIANAPIIKILPRTVSKVDIPDDELKHPIPAVSKSLKELASHINAQSPTPSTFLADEDMKFSFYFYDSDTSDDGDGSCADDGSSDHSACSPILGCLSGIRMDDTDTTITIESASDVEGEDVGVKEAGASRSELQRRKVTLKVRASPSLKIQTQYTPATEQPEGANGEGTRSSGEKLGEPTSVTTTPLRLPFVARVEEVPLGRRVSLSSDANSKGGPLSPGRQTNLGRRGTWHGGYMYHVQASNDAAGLIVDKQEGNNLVEDVNNAGGSLLAVTVCSDDSAAPTEGPLVRRVSFKDIAVVYHISPTRESFESDIEFMTDFGEELSSAPDADDSSNDRSAGPHRWTRVRHNIKRVMWCLCVAFKLKHKMTSQDSVHDADTNEDQNVDITTHQNSDDKMS
ncbi:hypothetical protein HK102_008707 [Quaeritorhiza haematococci]|nr:hypothetical protein HK102_008707 [Quaeritorhiza haematococci]